jgi:hypothetical protein
VSAGGWPLPCAPSLRAGLASPVALTVCAGVWRDDGTSATMVRELRVVTTPRIKGSSMGARTARFPV